METQLMMVQMKTQRRSELTTIQRSSTTRGQRWRCEGMSQEQSLSLVKQEAVPRMMKNWRNWEWVARRAPPCTLAGNWRHR